jgi:hypothetical protein
MYIDRNEVEQFTRPQRILRNIATGIGIVLAILILSVVVMDVIGMAETVTGFIEKVGSAL